MKKPFLIATLIIFSGLSLNAKDINERPLSSSVHLEINEIHFSDRVPAQKILEAKVSCFEEMREGLRRLTLNQRGLNLVDNLKNIYIAKGLSLDRSSLSRHFSATLTFSTKANLTKLQPEYVRVQASYSNGVKGANSFITEKINKDGSCSVDNAIKKLEEHTTNELVKIQKILNLADTFVPEKSE